MPSLEISKVPRNVLMTKYEVRGAVFLAAVARQREGKEVIFTSVGNPHALGQVPLTFLRQVIALVAAPFLLDDPAVARAFPKDAILRAKEYLTCIKSLGAYTDSRGSPLIRKQVAAWLEKRDGLRSNFDHIFLTDGASAAVRLGLQMLIRGTGFRDGILVPIPQYPLYSASIALLGGTLIPYELDEDAEWGLNLELIQKAVDKARADFVCPRGLVFINPGNPTGQQLTESQLLGMIKICHKEELALLCDEVYQDNVYQTHDPSAKPFISARGVLAKAGGALLKETQVLTFHTTSKGAFGECGLRGGMMEVLNVPENVVAEMYKLSSINLSPNVPGQVAMGVMLHPPVPGDESYPKWNAERQAVLDSLGRRAAAITTALNALPGVSCVAAGSLYAFPSIDLPPAAIAAATDKGVSPDVFYCLELLDHTGIATTPGSGFGQKDGTYHFRTTILPPEEKLDEFCAMIKEFHMQFIHKYAESPASRL
mmetsp:Transcript_30639/g.51773  ORF Transcript_30639/g.51773 Transcript_30639/m.51773 type:complete len:483 (+) Transcript_30639:242-1690(+)